MISKVVNVNTASEFPFVDEYSKCERSRWEQFWALWKATKEVMRDKGPLVPVSLAAKLADVSRQRMHELMALKKLDRVEIDGHVFVTEESLIRWFKTDDKGGRPGRIDYGKLWKLSHEYAKGK